jgi:hypothetical protein
MPRLVAASVEVQAHRGHFFAIRLSLPVLPDNHQPNRLIEAPAAAKFQAGKVANIFCGSGHAHLPLRDISISKPTTPAPRKQKFPPLPAYPLPA